MKGSFVAAAVASLATGASAGRLRHRHAHGMGKDEHHHPVGPGHDDCLCTTRYEVVYGEPTLIGHPDDGYEAPVTSTQEVVVVPTPAIETCPTPGTYTFPATTVTLTEYTTVCGASTTKVPAGTHVVGGVTTSVTTSTTIVCPYATTEVDKDDDDKVTSVIKMTTYVCPTPGTYTIAPITTHVEEETVIVVPVPEEYKPGTYTRPEKVVTVTETSAIVVCPYTDAPVPEPEKPSPPKEDPPKAPEPEPTKPSEPEKPSSPPAPIGGGDHYAMTYTPYNDDHSCKDKAQVEIDVAAIAGAGFKAIRVYGTDCGTLDSIGGACAKYGLKIILGIFVSGDGCSSDTPSVAKQISDIASWAQWSLVESIIVGNEAIFNGKCSASLLGGLISHCKATFSGYSGPYSTAETLNVWQKSDVQGALCDLIDFTGANIHAYFNPDVEASSAGDFVLNQLSIIDEICPGKQGINLESGWPSAGSCNGAACPGVDAQAAAIASIRAKAGSRTCFFSYFDDGWKEPGGCGCENHWGCGSLFTGA